MVNHGASRACKMCRMRRKKCDEARPSCLRCIKARRTCSGYDGTDRQFRLYRGTSHTQVTSNPALESCSHPKQSLQWTLEEPPESTPDEQMESSALASFLYEYCLIPRNRSLSHGYLDGLETLLARARPSSGLAQATNAVALASFGNRLNRPDLVVKSRLIYTGMLNSLQNMVSDTKMARTAEALLTVVLLGLYEMITATETHPSSHSSHSCGVYAILSTKNSPLNLLNWANRPGVPNSLLLKGPLKMDDIVYIPATNLFVHNLDILLLKSWSLLRKMQVLLQSNIVIVEELGPLLKEAKSLNEQYSRWPDSLPHVWRWKTIGYVNQKQVTLAQDLCWLSDRVDAYFDLYVAAVWNTYRKTRLVILDAIICSSKRLEQKSSYRDEQIQVEEMINDMAASIPFHYSGNLTEFMQQIESGSVSKIRPGRSIGSLLLMYSLFVAANLSITLPEVEARMRGALAWSGVHHGIGQATVLSKVRATFPNQAVANGYTLIWAGMLFTKVGIE